MSDPYIYISIVTPVVLTHSLELPFSRVSIMAVVEISERCQDLLEERAHISNFCFIIFYLCKCNGKETVDVLMLIINYLNF